MRVFITGASGFIGSAVVPELISAGHQVLGLARAETSAKALAAAGAEVLRGDLNDPASLRAGAAETEGVIHLGFIHDFDNFEASIRTDARAIETMGGVLAGSDRPFVFASGVVGLVPGQVATEEVPFDPKAHPRAANAVVALALAARGVRVSAAPAGADRPRSGGPRVRQAAGRHRPREGRLGLPRRGAKPLAGGAPTGRRQPVSPGARKSAGGRRRSRGRRGGRAHPDDRRDHREEARAAGGLDRPRGRGRALRLAQPVLRDGPAGVERADPPTNGLESDPPGARRRSRGRALHRLKRDGLWRRCAAAL